MRCTTRHARTATLILSVTSLVSCATLPNQSERDVLRANAQQSTGSTPSRAASSSAATASAHAVPGDTIYLIQHVVLATKRKMFERFLDESYWPTLRHLAASDSSTYRVLRQTRVLYPIRPNADSTFTYVFVMDPIVHGATYDILDFLRLVYSEQEAMRRYKAYAETGVPKRRDLFLSFVLSGAGDPGS